MIHFPPLRMHRMTVQLKELSIGESIAIAAMPPHLEQAECTAFLRGAVERVDGPEQLKDPADWTVQERIFAVGHYMAATTEDGPDFALGRGHYSDYLNVSGQAEEPDAPTEPVPIGEAGGDQWRIRSLTGRMAEAIERLQGEVKDARGEALPVKFHWILGAMAAQLVRPGETTGPEGMSEGDYDKRLAERMRIFLAFPETDFTALAALFFNGIRRIAHFFDIEFTREGIVVLPKEGAAGDLPPARFPVRASISPFAAGMGR